jgi:hypothetical protein
VSSKPQLQVRVETLVQHVLDKGRIEDDTVECKAQWPAPSVETALRIGGMANVARSMPALLIVGLDEDAKLITSLTNPPDPSDWFGQFEKWFDQVAPQKLNHQDVWIGDEKVVAVEWDTAAAPFVVNMAVPGKTHNFVVPWRDGTRYRSAHYNELVRIVLPRAEAPQVDWLGAECRLFWDGSETAFGVQLTAEVTVLLPPGAQALLLDRGVTGELSHDDANVTALQGRWFILTFQGPDRDHVLIDKPMRFSIRLIGTYQCESSDQGIDFLQRAPDLSLRLTLMFAGSPTRHIVQFPSLSPIARPLTIADARWGC